MTPERRARQDKINEYSRKRRERRQYWINKYKVAVGCFLCGYNEHSSALDFDHIDPAKKLFTPTSRLTRKLKSVFAEIRKCRILCANCHRIVTFHQRLRGDFKCGKPKIPITEPSDLQIES